MMEDGELLLVSTVQQNHAGTEQSNAVTKPKGQMTHAMHQVTPEENLCHNDDSTSRQNTIWSSFRVDL